MSDVPATIEIAAQPAGAQMRVGRTDLPVVAGREVRLVGVRVADRREHADLALSVQLGERRERRVPVQARVLRERRPGARARARGADGAPAYCGVPGRVEHRERVGSAVQEDGDEHRVGRATAAPGDALLEEPERELARAVHRERQAGRSGQEGATAETAAGRKRHPWLDAAAGRARPRPQSGGGRPRGRTRCRSSSSSAGLVVGRDGDEHAQGVQDEHRVLRPLPGLVGIRERGRWQSRGAPCECLASAPGSPQKSSARERSSCASIGSFPLEASGSSAYCPAA